MADGDLKRRERGGRGVGKRGRGEVRVRVSAGCKPPVQKIEMQLNALKGMHALYRISAARDARGSASTQPELKPPELARHMARLSAALDAGELSHEEAYYTLLEADPLRCSANTWLGARTVLARAGRSTSAFDVLWYCRARAEFDDRLDFGARLGEWAQAYAELLLVEYAISRPDDLDGLRSCDALIRDEMRSLSLADGCDDPDHIDRLLRLCPNLRALDLSGTAATRGNIATAIRCCPELRYIRLADTRLGGEAVEALIAALPACAIDI
jgi:hypothetical protein